jgi:hypothetical protein
LAHGLGSPHQQLHGNSRKVYKVAVGRLGARDVVVSASKDRQVRVWNADGRPIGKPLEHDGPV